MEKRWMLHTKRADFQGIARDLGIDPVTVRIIRNRGIREEEEMRRYLFGTLDDLYDPALLPQGEEAAALLREAISRGERIRIVGDYDIDGVCATYILYRGLLQVREALGRKEAEGGIDYVIPHRIRDGYGINRHIIEKALSDGVDLIITCDNGIAALEELRFAREQGVRVIVTDHHDIRLTEEGEEQLPPAEAVVDPKLRDSRYPVRNICGAVVAWKLLLLLYRMCGLSREAWLSFLDFAALATVGDVMELQGENRIIVRYGLKSLTEGCRNQGLCSLINRCGLSGKRITAYHLGFVIGPCINAGGRLETAEAALKLFLSEDPEEAAMLAEHLRSLNEERKLMTEEGVKEAERQALEAFPEDRVLVLFLPELHESLAGIVAGRIRERLGKPCIVLTRGAEGLKGSGRSIEAYHMFQGLCGVSGLLARFGGHPMAAGLSLPEENLEAFRRELNRGCGLSPEDFLQDLWIDMAMPLSYISGRLVEELSLLEPFGTGNEKPVFAAKGVQLTDLRVIGKNRNVLKCRVREETGTCMPAVIFGEADRMEKELKGFSRVNITYYPEINEYNGYKTLQLVIGDYRGTGNA